MSLRAPALALCGLFACSGPTDPAPLPAAPAPVAATPVAPPPATPPAKANDGRVSLMPAINSPAPAKEPPLTQEEIDLIATDPDTLTPEMRRQRGYALRRKILQNPDSPTARQLEALRLAYESGELQAQLPEQSSGGGITLRARQPEPATPTPPATTTPPPATPAPAPAPAKTP